MSNYCAWRRISAQLCISRPSRENVLNYCKYLIRKQEYEEITKSDSIKAVGYLQTKLFETIDHSDENQLNEVSFLNAKHCE